jgi:hypothetical protein
VKERRDRSSHPETEGIEREEPARFLVDGRRLGSGKPLPFNVAAVEAISIGRVESAPALRVRLKRGR